MQELLNEYKNQGVSLFLGAGVSINSGIPSWSVLLQRLSLKISNNSDLFKNLEQHGADYLSIASYLASQNKNWISLLREGIYRDFKYFGINLDKENKTAFVKYIEEENKTLSAIGNLLAIKNEGKRTFSANPNIKAVFTTNYDSILQAYCYAKFQKRILRTVERASAGNYNDKINLYHLHGMLRFDTKTSKDKEAPDKIILTENEYFERFSNPQNIFNYTLLTHLRENSFLFIGLSMTDMNIRRLLFLSKKEIYNSYLEEGISEKKLDKKIKTRVNKHYAILKRFKNEQINDYYQKTLINLGVNIIWVDDFNEISEIMSELKSIPTPINH